MKHLILGSTGFIGAALFKSMRFSGLDVVGADVRDSTEMPFIGFDALNPDFESLVREAKPDVVINCTGAASVPDSFIAPLHDYTLNTIRIVQMLDAIRLCAPTAKFVHFSSAAVYGNPDVSPVAETCRVKPLSPYGWHKYQAENICREYYEMFGVETISLRVFSAFGPGLKKQIFWDIYNKALRSKTLELFGTGYETRDFIYVDDVAKAVMCLIDKGCFDGRAVNVASGIASTIRYAAASLLSSLGLQKTIEFSGSERLGDPLNWQADIQYLSSLGYTPGFTLEQGLEKVAAWMHEQ
ncbi:NAD-dependent epimerase/dehydratase family protein [Pseudomonas sp. S1Bt23]|jgi:dTDP-glucose 4,6-dehydratase/UDP-glucose 4-epimerase|uniref:NAD-dependent epimerase/dehydratase family protein n=1 Tax=Pseudomonas sp. S1Bt23 TaxID=3095074 RepID=UPI002A5A6C01|nr:NAD-dependent epimerase/dehydratase family protein [Pseudomonas sp. S1Bt23]WPO45829.1 NAD-dependent epimerase/dehydratase family protein [Pseudomonas sp. S1Bt23]